MIQDDKEKLIYEEFTAHISGEEQERIQRSVKNYLANNKIMEEAERLLDEFGELKKIPEKVFYESEFDTVKLFTCCRVYDELRKNPPEAH